ncbi:MAG: hypothetical protein HY922_09260 [Elusimicrobia bacterium]|nr:hypothetical protein [Elusimicrobiota bacterium]
MSRHGRKGPRRSRILSDHPDMDDHISRLEELVQARTFKVRKKRIF